MIPTNLRPLEAVRFPNIFLDGRTVYKRWGDGTYTRIKPRINRLTGEETLRLTDKTTDESVVFVFAAPVESGVGYRLNEPFLRTLSQETGHSFDYLDSN